MFNMFATPIFSNSSFVSEHIETLEEIDMEYKHLALESGIENWGRVPALGCTSSFITDLADAVIEALPAAKAMTTQSTSKEFNMDPVSYAIKMFFGSILAFVLLLSPKMISMFKNQLIWRILGHTKPLGTPSYSTQAALTENERWNIRTQFFCVTDSLIQESQIFSLFFLLIPKMRFLGCNLRHRQIVLISEIFDSSILSLDIMSYWEGMNMTAVCNNIAIYTSWASFFLQGPLTLAKCITASHFPLSVKVWCVNQVQPQLRACLGLILVKN